MSASLETRDDHAQTMAEYVQSFLSRDVASHPFMFHLSAMVKPLSETWTPLREKSARDTMIATQQQPQPTQNPINCHRFPQIAKNSAYTRRMSRHRPCRKRSSSRLLQACRSLLLSLLAMMSSLLRHLIKARPCQITWLFINHHRKKLAFLQTKIQYSMSLEHTLSRHP